MGLSLPSRCGLRDTGEGIDLWTLFYSNAQPVGDLGYYGHWLGVNWVWTIGLLIFHSVYSIGLPIFLFGLVFAELKSKSLVFGRRLSATITCLIVDSIFLYSFVSTYYKGLQPRRGPTPALRAGDYNPCRFGQKTSQ